MATYLITGGAGFIGSHLADALTARGDRVRVVDDLSTGRRENLPPGVELMVGCITDDALLARAMDGVAGCFHLAAIASVARSVEDWVGTHLVNQSAALRVFNAAARTAGGPVPVVYASSAAVYGNNPAVPLNEGAAPRPLSGYGADKLATEYHALAGGATYGLPSFGLRFFNVYGPRQDPHSPYSGVISIFADRAWRGEDLVLFGDGGQVRDFVYIGDVVRFLLAAMAKASPEAPVANVGTGIGVRIADLADLVLRLTGSQAAIRHAPPRASDIRTSICDTTGARALLGIGAETSLEVGLTALLRG